MLKLAYCQKNAPKCNFTTILIKSQKKQKINLGFTHSNLPNKEWLINILYTLDEHLQIFKKFQDSDSVLGITQDDLNVLKSLDTSYGRKKTMKYFQRTSDHVLLRKQYIQNQKLNNLKSQLKRRKQEEGILEQKIKTYQYKIEQHESTQNSSTINQLQFQSGIQKQQKH